MGAQDTVGAGAAGKRPNAARLRIYYQFSRPACRVLLLHAPGRPSAALSIPLSETDDLVWLQQLGGGPLLVLPGSGLGERRRGEAKLTARSSWPRCDWRAEGWSEPGREGLERESQRLRVPAACRGEGPRLKPLTVSVAATVINPRRFPWYRRDRSGQSGIGCRFERSRVSGQKVKPPINIISRCAV